MGFARGLRKPLRRIADYLQLANDAILFECVTNEAGLVKALCVLLNENYRVEDMTQIDGVVRPHRLPGCHLRSVLGWMG